MKMAATNTTQTNSVLKHSLHLQLCCHLILGVGGLSFDTLVTAPICIVWYFILWLNLNPALLKAWLFMKPSTGWVLGLNFSSNGNSLQPLTVNLYCSDPIDRFPTTSRICGSLIITPQIIPGGAERTSKCIMFYGENPTSARIPACKLRLGIATCWKPSPVCGAKRALSSAICYNLVRPSLTEIQPVGNHSFFSKRTICAYSDE